MKVRDILISDIIIEDRFREEYGDIEELAESIKVNGIIQPITISEEMVLIAGGRRLIAAQLADLEKIPCVIRDIKDKIEAKEIELFENLHRKNLEWYESILLHKQIHEMMKEKYGDDWSGRKTSELLNKSVGYTSEALNLADALEIIPDLKKQPTLQQAKREYNRIGESMLIKALKEGVEKGEIVEVDAQGKERRRKTKGAQLKWFKGYHRGDCYEKLKNRPNCCYNFAEVDPPYGIDIIKKKKGNQDDVIYTESDEENYRAFSSSVANEVYRTLKDNAFCIWWFGYTHRYSVYSALTEAGFHVDELPAIWYKIKSGAQTNQPEIYLARSYETFFVCRKGKPVMMKRGRSNVFSFQTVSYNDKTHPTERPLDLMTELLQTFCAPGAKIVIPFLGSGKTMWAAHDLHMKAEGWEIDKARERIFFDQTLKWIKETGRMKYEEKEK